MSGQKGKVHLGPNASSFAHDHGCVVNGSNMSIIIITIYDTDVFTIYFISLIIIYNYNVVHYRIIHLYCVIRVLYIYKHNRCAYNNAYLSLCLHIIYIYSVPFSWVMR